MKKKTNDLFAAIKDNDLFQVNELLEANFDNRDFVNSTNEDNNYNTPLYFALKNKVSKDILEALLNGGADPNLVNGWDHANILLLMYSDETLGKLSYEETEKIGEVGELPLHYTIVKQDLENTKLLLNYKADVNLLNIFQKHSLEFFPNNLEFQVAKELLNILIEYGADIHKPFPDGHTFLNIVLRKIGMENQLSKDNLFSYAIELGCTSPTLNAQNNSGLHSLIRLLNAKRLKDINLAIELIPEILNGTNKEGDTVLHTIVNSLSKYDSTNDASIQKNKNQMELLKICLELGCSIDSKNKEGITPLDLLIEYYNIEFFIDTIKDLAELGIVNQVSNKGFTILQNLAIYLDQNELTSKLPELLRIEFDGMAIFNLNKLSSDDERLIDILQENEKLDNDLLKVLRNLGSVEPKVPQNNDHSKLILKEDVSPDFIVGNQSKVENILDIMFHNYPMSEDDMDTLINNFKAFYENVIKDCKAKWTPNEENINTVYDVVEKLATLRSVDDRLDENWDFKYVLACVISIVDQDQELAYKLIDTLAQIKKCSLSKLINLIYVVQDKLLEPEGNDYTKIGFDDFHEIIELTLNEIKQIENYPLIIIKWLNDHINKQDIQDPEDWHLGTQKINGIFNKVFAENFPGVTNDSYHFTDGLGSVCIYNLINQIQLYKEDNNNPLILEWQNVVRDGAVELAKEFFEKIVSGEIDIKSIENADFSYDLSFGYLTKMPSEVISKYFNEIKEKLESQKADFFLEKVRDYLILNDEVQKFIDQTLTGNNIDNDQDHC